MADIDTARLRKQVPAHYSDSSIVVLTVGEVRPLLDTIDALKAEVERLTQSHDTVSKVLASQIIKGNEKAARIAKLEGALRDVESKICSGNDHGAVDLIEAALNSKGTCKDYLQVGPLPRALESNQ